jgi:sulfopyruvate decarboxylase subunit alpha
MSKRLADLIVGELRRSQVDLVAGLPDRWLTDLIETLRREGSPRFLSVAREDEAVGVCAGYHLVGKRAVMLAQNSGFLLASDALTALCVRQGIPIAILVSYRGSEGDAAPYHRERGRVTLPVVEALGLPWFHVREPSELHLVSRGIEEAQSRSGPAVVLLGKRALLEAK